MQAIVPPDVFFDDEEEGWLLLCMAGEVNVGEDAAKDVPIDTEGFVAGDEVLWSVVEAQCVKELLLNARLWATIVSWVNRL